MKNLTRSLGLLAVVLLFGTAASVAQSTAAGTALAKAGHNSGAASREAIRASGASIVASAHAAAGLTAVPVWMSGVVITGSGQVITAVGDAAVLSGAAVTRDAVKLWDFANDDSGSRPPLARERAVPPAPTAVPKKDPSPAEALRITQAAR